MHGAVKTPTFVRTASEPRAGHTTHRARAAGRRLAGRRPHLSAGYAAGAGRSLVQSQLCRCRLRSEPFRASAPTDRRSRSPLRSASITAVRGTRTARPPCSAAASRSCRMSGNLTRNVIIRSENPSGTQRPHALHASIRRGHLITCSSRISAARAPTPLNAQHQPHRTLSASHPPALGTGQPVEHRLSVRGRRQCRQRQPQVADRRARKSLRAHQAERRVRRLAADGRRHCDRGRHGNRESSSRRISSPTSAAASIRARAGRARPTARRPGRRRNASGRPASTIASSATSRRAAATRSSRSCPGPGWKFIVPAAPYTARNPRFRGADMTDDSQTIAVTPQHQPILEFRGNEVYGLAADGLTAWQLGTDGYGIMPPTMGESLIKDFRVWHTYEGAIYNYPAHRMTVDGLVYRVDPRCHAVLAGGVSVRRLPQRRHHDPRRQHPRRAASSAAASIRSARFASNSVDAVTWEHAFSFETPATPGTGADRPASGVTMVLRNNVVRAVARPTAADDRDEPHDVEGQQPAERQVRRLRVRLSGPGGQQLPRLLPASRRRRTSMAALAPCTNTTARPEIDGITCPMTGTAPTARRPHSCPSGRLTPLPFSILPPPHTRRCCSPPPSNIV